VSLPAHGKPAQHGKPVDHKAAIDKMHPEHLHRLVQDAHAAKFGPQAQQSAQQAMQPPVQQSDGDADDMPQRGGVFGKDDDMDDAPQAAPPRGSIFAGRGGF